MSAGDTGLHRNRTGLCHKLCRIKQLARARARELHHPRGRVRAGHPVAFYFIPENPDPRLDNRVSLGDPRLRALPREIHARGHEIDIHPGYHTYRHPRGPGPLGRHPAPGAGRGG